jgi:hypothetical protein
MKSAKEVTAVFSHDLALNEEVPAEAEVGALFLGSVHPTGGTGPYSFAITSGALPNGIVLQGETIQGTPVSTGTSKFVLTVTDQSGATVSASHSIKVYRAITITTSSLAVGAVGHKYKSSLKAAGGQGPYNWTLWSWLPPGLDLNNRTGQITGIPTTTGTYNVTFQANDSIGNVQKTITIQIN